MPESLPAVFTRLVADNVGQYEKSLVIDLGGTTLDVGVIVGQFEDVSAVHGNRGLTLSGTKTHVKQRFLPLTPLLMVSDVLWSPVLPA